MKSLPRKPAAPSGVKYALTVPQSVIFADLSLQGNRRAIFKEVLEIDYEPPYIAIDAGGAMSWNYDDDKDFDTALIGASDSTVGAIDLFVALMERTARKLNKVSKNIESPALRKDGKAGLLEDLLAYWQAYEQHMSSLFTFWNVEKLLSDTLTAELKAAGRQHEISDGLTRYLKPDEPNYFVMERLALKKITDRFEIKASMTSKDAPKPLVKALEAHRETYGFLLAPFNIDNPLTLDDLLERAKETAGTPLPAREPRDTFTDLPADLRHLAKLAQRFTFWKSERLDLFALADARAKQLYQQAASSLSLEADDLFAMTSGEIAESLKANKAVVAKDVLSQRRQAYCLVLAEGKIAFYAPASITDKKNRGSHGPELEGVAASAGVARGKVRIIQDLKDAKKLQKGEVIVTAMTRPEMGVALDRASAFVTDEGGLLCHAAIISREMKKPCVIATGNATKLLKNGQDIEVDGSKGLVRIISAD